MNDKVTEIKNFWSYYGEASEVDDIVSLREMACSDIEELVQIIVKQHEELKAWRNDYMAI